MKKYHVADVMPFLNVKLVLYYYANAQYYGCLKKKHCLLISSTRIVCVSIVCTN